MMTPKLRMSLLAGIAAVVATLGAQAQTIGADGTSTTESSGFAAGRHADGGTGVRKAESSTTTSTSGGASGAKGSSASTSGPSGSSVSGPSGSAADPAPGASGYARDNAGTGTKARGTSGAPGQKKKQEQ